MSIYTNAVYHSNIRKFASDEQEQIGNDQEARRINSLKLVVNNPQMVTADRIKAAYALYQSGEFGDVPLTDILKGIGRDIQYGVKEDYTDLAEGAKDLYSQLHKKYTVAKNDAISRYNKFKADLPGMYAEGKKQLGDFYDANKGAVWAGGLGALGGGTIGASVAKNKLLGGLVGAGVGAGASLGALRIAKYLGYDI